MQLIKRLGVGLSAFLLVFSISTQSVSAHVQVTEFMANPDADSNVVLSDANGEWLELINTGNQDISLDGWSIATGSLTDTTPTTTNFPDDIVLLPGQTFVICENEDTAENGSVVCNTELSISLTNSGGSVTIYDADSEVVDAITYYGSENEEEAPSENYEAIEDGASAQVTRDENGEQTGTTNETDKTYGPSADAEDEDSPAQHGTPANNTVYNSKNENHKYATIEEAIEDAEDNDTIIVGDDQQLSGTLNITRPVTLSTETRCAVVVEGKILINAENVTISKLTLTNPDGNGAITVSADGSTIEKNCIEDIGTNDVSGNVQAIYINGNTSTPVNDTYIYANSIKNVASTTLSTKAIYVEETTNLIVTNNVISNVMSTRGGYGLLLNRQSDHVEITNNIISDIYGEDWTHAISLDDENPNTTITGNIIRNVTSNPGTTDIVGVFIEESGNDIATTNITDNKFTNVLIGIANLAEQQAEYRLNATNNWWGDDSGPYDPIANDASLPETNSEGKGVAVVGAVDYRNWQTADEEKPKTPTPPTSTPITQPQRPSQSSPTASPAVYYSTPTGSATNNQGVASENNTEPQTSSTSTEESSPSTTDSVASTVNPNEAASWLERNWLLIVVIIFGGTAIWYFFVRPNTEV